MNLPSDLKLKEALTRYWNERLSEIPSDEELESSVLFSPEFEKKMNKLIKRQKKPYYKLFNTTVKRVAAIIIFGLLTFTAAMSVEAIRAPVINFIMEVYEKFSIVVFGSEEDAVSQPESIQEVYLPVVPDGFELLTGQRDALFVHFEYENEAKQYIIYEQDILGATITINSEDIEIQSVIIHGFEGIYYENLGVNSLLWSDGRYSFSLMSDLEKEEMLLVAETLIAKK